ncbi:MAG TPA: hypothetical protein VGG30_03875 [Pirellulales bacterium]
MWLAIVVSDSAFANAALDVMPLLADVTVVDVAVADVLIDVAATELTLLVVAAVAGETLGEVSAVSEVKLPAVSEVELTLSWTPSARAAKPVVPMVCWAAGAAGAVLDDCDLFAFAAAKAASVELINPAP